MSNHQNIDPKANTKNSCHTHNDKSLAIDYALSHKLLAKEISSLPRKMSYLFSLSQSSTQKIRNFSNHSFDVCVTALHKKNRQKKPKRLFCLTSE